MSTESSAFDLIGDLHGHASALRALLKEWGYTPGADGIPRHPAGRRVLFVGDYVDRGPEIVATLRLVRGMVEAGEAVALMGNHEFNAVALDHVVAGRPLRSADKRHQHQATIDQLAAAGEERAAWLDWFRTLPLWHEEAGFRVVHACWDARHHALLRAGRPDGRLRPADWDALADQEGPLAQAVECLLKGPEVRLPDGLTFPDREGHGRRDMRVRWWAQEPPLSWRTVSLGDWPPDWADRPFDAALLTGEAYPPGEKPVFCGHYSLRGTPRWLAGNVCCLDYSVAQEGSLVGYRLGDGAVTGGRFHAVPAGGVH
jgi:hypothetical protein